MEEEREPGAPTTSLNLFLTNSHVGYKYVKNKMVRSDCPWRTKEKVFILQRLMLILRILISPEVMEKIKRRRKSKMMEVDYENIREEDLEGEVEFGVELDRKAPAYCPDCDVEMIPTTVNVKRGNIMILDVED